MYQKQVRLDLLATGLNLQVGHEATCPSVSPVHCKDAEIPDHFHDVGLAWLRLQPQLSVGLGGGWQASVAVPLDIRATDVTYSLADGSAFEPAYASMHHRKETLLGLVDARLRLAWVGRWPGGWIVSASGGSTLPLGRTEENPYALTQLGLEHQHFQMGTGTFQPLAGLRLVKEGAVWRQFAGFNTQISAAENEHGYRASTIFGLDAGTSRELGKRLDMMLGLMGSHITQDAWSGALYPGQQTVNLKLGLTTHLGLNWLLEGQAMILLAERTLGGTEGDVLSQKASFTVGASWRN